MSDRIDPKPVRFTRSARKHRIGRAHALAAMDDAGRPVPVPATDDTDAALLWVGRDLRGLELEVIALDLPDHLLVIHVMPRRYRREEEQP